MIVFHWTVPELKWLVSSLQIADFGLAHAGRSGGLKFELVTTEVRGTPGNYVRHVIYVMESTQDAFPCSVWLFHSQHLCWYGDDIEIFRISRMVSTVHDTESCFTSRIVDKLSLLCL